MRRVHVVPSSSCPLAIAAVVERLADVEREGGRLVVAGRHAEAVLIESFPAPSLVITVAAIDDAPLAFVNVAPAPVNRIAVPRRATRSDVSALLHHRHPERRYGQQGDAQPAAQREGDGLEGHSLAGGEEGEAAAACGGGGREGGEESEGRLECGW
eukprot:scaffold140672_cov76-Cyclotella_meneghiniana.AAC.1